MLLAWLVLPIVAALSTVRASSALSNAAGSVQAAALATVTAGPNADALVSQAFPSKNYGTSTYLQVDGTSHNESRSYIRFAVSGLAGPIQSVTLRVYCTTDGTANGPEVYLADSNWIESGKGSITWNKQPALLGGVLANAGAIATSSWVSYDVTPAVTGNGTYTFALFPDSTDSARFSSREGAQPAQLVITLASTPTPTGTSASQPISTPTSTLVPATATPTLGAAPTNTPTPISSPTATPTSGSAPVFSDGFESGNLSAWTTSGGLTVQSTTVHTGSYAAEGNTTNGDTYAKKLLPTTYSDGYARIYFDLVSYSSQVNLLRYRTAADASIAYLLVDPSGKLGFRNDIAATTVTSTTSVTSGWHALEFHAVMNGASSSTEVWLDGSPVSDLSLTTDFGANLIGKVQIGEVNTGRTYDVVFDDVTFDTQPIGLPGTATATPTATAPGSPTQTPTSAPTATSTPGSTGSIQHVFVVLMENHSYSEVWNTSSSPYITQLGNAYARATNYYAITHPSLPNYLDLYGGDNYGITTDCTPSSTCHVNAVSLADNLEAKGLTWRAYEESMPSPCYLSNSGNYAPKHNPFVYFDDIRTNTTRCDSHDVPYTDLSADLASAATTPNYAFITPNLCNDMHDCSVSTGDTWLSNNLPPILNSPACTVDKCLLILTWDEDDNSAGNHVLTIFAGSAAKTGGVTSAVSYTHFSMLRTIENIFGLPTQTSNDAAASPMTDLLR